MQDDELMITAEGYKKIQAELEEIYKVTRPQIIERVRQARLLGDLSENSEYDDAKRAQGFLETHIAELKHILGTARIVDESEIPEDCVRLGSTVVVKDLEEGEEEEFTIVGRAEANPLEGKISNESTVGKALLHKKAGDKVDVEVPIGVVHYEILSVNC